MSCPENLRYAKSHEWSLIKDDTVVVGITDFAQNQLGDVVYLELPAIGTQVEKGKEFGVIESVKAVSELYAPLSGEIVKVNNALIETTDTINKDPYDQGWMIQIKLKNKDEIKDLLSQSDYQKLIEH